MRFAYIDSQGNEVPIPSVEALGLRIELGAIGPDTELYDAQADRWGPAHTHEIFHTLFRDSGEGGFVAPPPPVAPPQPPDEPEPPPAGGSTDEDLSKLGEELGILPEEPRKPVADAPAGSDFGADLDFGLTLTDAPAPPPPPPAAAPRDEARAPEPTAPGDEEGAMEFGTLTPLDLDQVEDLREWGEPLTPQDSPFVTGSSAGGDAPFPGENVMDFTSGPLDGGGDADPSGRGLAPDAPPAWMEQDGPAWGGEEEVGTMRFGPGGADLDGDLDAFLAPTTPPPAPRPRPERPEPRTRPSPPRRVQRRAPAVIGWILVLALVGAGGWFGWKALGGFLARGGDDTATAELPPVTIPSIPAALEPRMRALGNAALDGTIRALHGIPGEMKLEEEPRNDWLSGSYLANASKFPDIEAYWTGIDSLVDRVRDTDTRVFHEQYVARLDSAGIEGDTASILLARADSGFLATRADRFEAYAEMDDLVNAALDLHQFLLRNEADIEYAPAAGGYSRDPVLEAVPASKALGEEMWGMVDRITEALDALGSLDKVTTDRLAGVLLDRVRQAGFR